MKSIRRPCCRQPACDHRPHFEPLESRELLTAAASAALHPLQQLPNETTISSPQFSDLWHLKNLTQPGADVHAEDAWDLTTGSNNVVIALFDTGIDFNNPDFANSIWHNPLEIPGNGIDDDHNGFTDDVTGWNFIDGNNNPQDTSLTNHGTTVAGVLASQGNNALGTTGVAWNVSILPIKIGTDSGVSDTDLINGINYVNALKQRGVNIVAINASFLAFGVPGLSALNAIKSAGSNGMLYISAAGNSATNYDTFVPGGFLPSNMIMVAATDIHDQLADFSSYGKKTVALAAPGVDILTSLRGGLYVKLSGTSYAGPMVSGALALMKSLVPNATMAQLKSALLAGVDVLPSVQNKVISGGRLNVYKSLELLLGQKGPQGWVDVFTKDTISGWVFDANAGRKASNLQIVVDGVTTATFAAANTRNDLTDIFGSANHGFSYQMPTLSAGNHTVQVYAVDFAPYGTPLARTLLAQQTFLAPGPPIGSVDFATSAVVAGWALDRDTPATAVSVRVDIDGSTALTGTADKNRADLVQYFGSANHGYSFALPTLSVGFHRIDVYATDTTTGVDQLIGSRVINTNVAPTGSLDSFTGSSFSGWAFDANAGADSIQILYKLDGNDPILATASNNRGDLTGIFGSPLHGFNVALPQLTAGSHTLTVWAVDSTTQALTLIGNTGTVITAAPGNTLPKASVDSLSTAGISGWAYDANLNGAPATIRIDIDGIAGTPFLANKARSDLTPVLGGPNFAFAEALSLSPGQHRIDLYVLDAPGLAATLITSRVIGTGTPAASLDVANADVLAGWAYLPGLAGDPATIRIDIDSVPALLTVASAARSDLEPVFGTPNLAFHIATPPLLAGTHTITLRVVNPLTLNVTLLASRTITVA